MLAVLDTHTRATSRPFSFYDVSSSKLGTIERPRSSLVLPDLYSTHTLMDNYHKEELAHQIARKQSSGLGDASLHITICTRLKAVLLSALDQTA